METHSYSSILVITLLALAIPIYGAAAQKHHHDKFVDVGNFGGSNAFVSAPLPGEVQINQRGLVAGVADTPDADPYSPNCLVDCSLAHAFAWKDGVLRDLGALPGTNNRFAFSANVRGLIVGLSENGAFDPLTGYPEVHAVLWSDGERPCPPTEARMWLS
jgi:hypothetical protein